MCALLVQQSPTEVLECDFEFDIAMTEKDKKTLLEKTHIPIVLSLDDKVLRQVWKEKTTMGLLPKLESLCKSLVNCLYLKQPWYLYKISSGKTISEQLHEFN